MNAIVESLDVKRKAHLLQQCERAVIGGILLDNSAINRAPLSPGDFSNKAYGQIFEVLMRLINQKLVADAMIVADHLQRESSQTNWLPFVGKIVVDTPSAANVHVYAERIRQTALARRSIEIAQFMIKHVEDTPEKSIDLAIRELMSLTATTTDWSCHQYEAMQSAIDYIDQASSGFLGVSYGIRAMDERVGGMHPGDLVVIAARPAMGKTAFMLNMAANCNVPVGLISGEQGRSQMGMRIMSIGGHVSLYKMRKGTLGDDEWVRLTNVMSALRDKPVWVYDKPGPTIDDIRRQARTWRYDKNIKLIIVDYLQKIRGGEGKDIRQQVGSIAAQFKDLGRELNIPIVALAQVNRDVEKNPIGTDGMGRMPYMSDIAESGVIEMEADTIFTLYRPEVYMPNSDEHRGIAYANCCKSRHGPVGKIKMAWRGEYLQFGDLAHTERE